MTANLQFFEKLLVELANLQALSLYVVRKAINIFHHEAKHGKSLII